MNQKEKGNKRNKQNSGKSKLSLPPVILVYKNKEMIDSLKRSQEEKESYKTWEDMDWNDDGGKKVVKIIPAADDEHEIASAIYINMSSNALARIISEEGTAGTKIEFSQEQFMTAIYSNSFLILAAINSLKKKNNSNIAQLNDFDNIEEFVGDIVEEFAYAVVKMQINNVNTSKELL